MPHVVSTHLYCAYCDMFLDLLPLSVSCSMYIHVAFQEQETVNTVDNQLSLHDDTYQFIVLGTNTFLGSF